MQTINKEDIKKYEDIHISEDMIDKLHHIYELVHDGHYIDNEAYEDSIDVAYKISKLLFEKKINNE